MEHEPGPRGSPQVLQALGEWEELPEPFALTAKTESCGASFLLWHLGHSALSLPKTSASNWCSQSLQTYSKIGIMPLLSALFESI